MPAKVPISEIGSASAGISVARTLRRKRKMTMTTSTIGQRQRELHVVDRRRGSRSSDRSGRRGRRRRGSSASNAGSIALTAVDHLDGVGVGLAVDARARWRGCRCSQLADLVVLDASRSTVATSPRRTGAPFCDGDDHRLVVGRLGELARWPRGSTCWRWSASVPTRRVRVGGGDRVLQLVDADAARRRARSRSSCDAHGVFLAAEDQHLGHAGQRRDARRDQRARRSRRCRDSGTVRRAAAPGTGSA